MAVQDEASFKRYAANGIATVYAIPFLLLNAADLQVVLDDVEVTTGFTVTGVGTNTGSITFDVAPSGDLLLQRVVPFERLTDYQDNGDLLADTVNRDFDRLWLAMQELRRDDSTALRTSSLEPEGISPLPISSVRALRVLAFDEDGEPIISSMTLSEIQDQPALAVASAAAAAAAASTAAGSASAAAGSASAAATARDKAQDWADKAEDSEVEPGKFSAKHWAAKAAASVSGLDTRVTSLEAKGIKTGTAQASTSGTAIDFTGIPSAATKLTFIFSGVSTSGTSNYLIQIGTSSGIENTGYQSGVSQSGATTQSTAGFICTQSVTAAAAQSGLLTICRLSQAANTWVCSGTINHSATNFGSVIGGTKTLSGALDRIRLTTVAGTDSFDAGSVNIIWEL